MTTTITTPGQRTAPTPTATEQAPVTRQTAWSYRTTDGLWAIEHDDDDNTPWTATYLPTRQYVLRTSLAVSREAIADGTAHAELRAQDTAALAKPCPGGCGRPAAALVNTVDGPAPVCADHRPVIQARGYTTRIPCTVCGASTDGPECPTCTAAHDHTVNRSTDL